MTKIIIICSSAFLIFTCGVWGFADEHFPFLAEVSKESVNVRAGPNTNFDKIDKLTKGTKVVVLGRSYEWLKVQPLPTTSSYIRCDYLKIIKGEDIAVVSGDNVNIRCAASSDAASLGEVKQGQLVKLEAQANGWCKLDPVQGTSAWIHQDFLKHIADDVPASLLIAPLQIPVVVPIPAVVPQKKMVETVSLQGKMQAIIPETLDGDVHYEVAIDDKTVYYLQDMPQMAFFANMVVAIDGEVIPDPQKKYIYPVVHINKIVLVL